METEIGSDDDFVPLSFHGVLAVERAESSSCGHLKGSMGAFKSGIGGGPSHVS